VSAQEVLRGLRARGVVLEGGNGKLRYKAPIGSLTAEQRLSLIANKAAILDLLEAERLSNRRIVHCADCAHQIPARPLRRASGALWDMPGGCAQHRTSPDDRPPIYPCTGWYCDKWVSNESR